MLKLLAATGTLLGAGLMFGTGVAHAEGYQNDQDGSAYWREVWGDDPGSDPRNAESAKDLGIRMCIERDVKSERELIATTSGIMLDGQPVGYHQAVVIMVGAEFHFCPQYLG